MKKKLEFIESIEDASRDRLARQKEFTNVKKGLEQQIEEAVPVPFI